MTNILIEGYGHIPSYDLTSIAFKRYASILDIEVRSKLSRHITPEDINWCDILICVRANNPLSSYLAKYASKHGRIVLLALDDDILSFKGHQHPLYERWQNKSLINVINLSKIIITSSNYLGEKYKKQFKIEYVQVDTPVTSDDFKHQHSYHTQTRLLYASSHIDSFRTYVQPILNKLYDCYGDSIHLTIMGADIDTKDIRLPIEKVASMSLDDYRQYMNNHSFDIGFAPLIGSEMSKSKYYNKFLEYTMQGICGIYSNNLPYITIVKDGQNGLLANDDPQDWFDKICKIIDNIELRKNCVGNAEFLLKKEFSLDTIVEKLRSNFPEIDNFKANHKTKFRWFFPSYIYFLFLEVIRRFLIYIK